MASCRYCADLWEHGGQAGAEAVHFECSAAHGRSGPIRVGPGPITAFGWLRTDGPPVAFARGPAPLYRGDLLLDATATDLDPALAATKAVAELLERQTAYLRPRAPVRLDHAASPAVVPRWQVEARLITNGDPVLLPAAQFMLSSVTTHAGPGDGDSTGMAAGPSSRVVIVAGLLEVIERAGLNEIDVHGPGWRTETHDLCGSYERAVRRQGWEVDVIGVTYAGFMVGICVASRDGRSVIGAAAHPEPRAAANAALAEAYTKTVGLRDDNHAIVSSGTRIPTTDLWPDLPAPVPRPAAPLDPLATVEHFGVRVAMVDRGNALLDAMGWCAAQVALLEAPRSTPGGFRELL